VSDICLNLFKMSNVELSWNDSSIHSDRSRIVNLVCIYFEKERIICAAG